MIFTKYLFMADNKYMHKDLCKLCLVAAQMKIKIKETIKNAKLNKWVEKPSTKIEQRGAPE